MDKNKRLRLITKEGAVREFPDDAWEDFQVIDSLLFLKKGNNCVAIYNMEHVLCVEYL